MPKQAERHEVRAALPLQAQGSLLLCCGSALELQARADGLAVYSPPSYLKESLTLAR